MKYLMALKDTDLGRFLEFIGALTQMAIEAFKTLFKNPPSANAVAQEIKALGVKSLVIVIVAALATGLVMALQFGYGFARFGAKLYVPKVVTISIVRELGPIFTALMLAGRVGAGIAAEIGSMTVTQQVDAIRALGTNPMNKLILPKIIATTISAPILTMLANFLGIVGGMIIASAALGLSAFDYFFKAFEIMSGRDVMGGVVKSCVFGFLIGLVGCCVGMRTRGGTQGVGNSTTQAVVMASILVLVFDFVVTQVIWIFEHAFTSGVV